MEKAGDILKKVLEANAIKLQDNENSIFVQWSKIVDEPLKSHTSVIDVRKQVLMIRADHPGIMQVFQFNERGILRKIRKRFPGLKIKSIRIQVWPKNINKEVIGRENGREKKKQEKGAETVKDVSIQKIEDLDLKMALESLYSAILKKGH
jgi:hypothetical protein